MDSYKKAEKNSLNLAVRMTLLCVLNKGTLISKLGIFISKQTEQKVQVHTSLSKTFCLSLLARTMGDILHFVVLAILI